MCVCVAAVFNLGGGLVCLCCGDGYAVGMCAYVLQEAPGIYLAVSDPHLQWNLSFLCVYLLFDSSVATWVGCIGHPVLCLAGTVLQQQYSVCSGLLVVIELSVPPVVKCHQESSSVRACADGCAAHCCFCAASSRLMCYYGRATSGQASSHESPLVVVAVGVAP